MIDKGISIGSHILSGAIQHIAGIKESGKIVAIDHNAKASIFHHADFGIVGEYEDIVPELIERVKNGFAFRIEPAKKTKKLETGPFYQESYSVI